MNTAARCVCLCVCVCVGEVCVGVCVCVWVREGSNRAHAGRADGSQGDYITD